MKKILTFLALCCLMVTEAWADGFQASTVETPVVYVLTNANNMTIASNLTYHGSGGSSAAPKGKFAFISTGETDKYKIYETISQKYVALSSTASIDCKSGTQLVSSDDAAETFTITASTTSGQFLISPTSIGATYLNFNGGASGNSGGQTVGFWTDGNNDAGSRWTFAEPFTFKSDAYYVFRCKSNNNYVTYNANANDGDGVNHLANAGNSTYSNQALFRIVANGDEFNIIPAAAPSQYVYAINKNNENANVGVGVPNSEDANATDLWNISLVGEGLYTIIPKGGSFSWNCRGSAGGVNAIGQYNSGGNDSRWMIIEVTAPFEAGKTYTMTLHGKNVKYNAGGSNFTLVSDAPEGDEFLYTVGGDPANGYTFKSKGADNYVGYTQENVYTAASVDNAVASPNETAAHYDWYFNGSDAFLKIHGTNNNYVNDYANNNKFSTWNDGSALGKDGSKMTFTEVELPAIHFYTVTVIGAPAGQTPEVSYKGTPINENRFGAETDLVEGDITATDYTGYTKTITFDNSARTVTVVYTFNSTVVTGLSDIVDGRIYTISSKDRGGLVYDSANADYISGSGRAGKTFDATDKNFQFAFIQYGGATYLYSMGAEKFAVYANPNVKVSAEAPAAGITLLESTGTDKENYPVVIAIDGSHQINISTAEHQGALTTWNAQNDPGNMLRIESVGDLSEADLAAIKGVFYTYTLNFAGAPAGATLQVTYGDKTYDSETPIVIEDFDINNVQPSEIMGYAPEVSLSGKTINVRYTQVPVSGNTYRVTLKGDTNYIYYVKDETAFKMSSEVSEDDLLGYFLVGGNETDGYTLYNVGARKYVKQGSGDNNRATTTSDESEAARYDWTVKDGKVFFKIHGTTNTYVNDNANRGYVSTWQSNAGLGDPGSKMTFAKVEYSLPELTHAVAPSAGIITNVADFGAVRVTFTGEDIAELDSESSVAPTLSNGTTSIEGSIAADDETDELDYVITFPTTGIVDGAWTLTIPQGTFIITVPLGEGTQDAPVAAISVAYTVDIPLSYDADKYYTINRLGTTTYANYNANAVESNVTYLARTGSASSYSSYFHIVKNGDYWNIIPVATPDKYVYAINTNNEDANVGIGEKDANADEALWKIVKNGDGLNIIPKNGSYGWNCRGSKNSVNVIGQWDHNDTNDNRWVITEVNTDIVPLPGEYIRLLNRNYNRYMNANGNAVNSIGDGTGVGTLWYVTPDMRLMNVGTGAFLGNISTSAVVSLNATNTTTFEFEVVDSDYLAFKQSAGGDSQYGHINNGNSLVGWSKGVPATQWTTSKFDIETVEYTIIVTGLPDGNTEGGLIYAGQTHNTTLTAAPGLVGEHLSAAVLTDYEAPVVTVEGQTITVAYHPVINITYSLWLKDPIVDEHGQVTGYNDKELVAASEPVHNLVGCEPVLPFEIPAYIDVAYENGITDGVIDGKSTNIKVITSYNDLMPFTPGALTTVDIDIRHHYYFHVEKRTITIDGESTTLWLPCISPKAPDFDDDAAYIWRMEGDWYNGFRFHNDQIALEATEHGGDEEVTNCHITFHHQEELIEPAVQEYKRYFRNEDGTPKEGCPAIEDMTDQQKELYLQRKYKLVKSDNYNNETSRATLTGDVNDASSYFDLVYAIPGTRRDKEAAYQFKIHGTNHYLNFRDEAAYANQNPDSLLCLYGAGYGDNASSFTFHSNEVCTEDDRQAVLAMIDAIEKGAVGAIIDKTAQEYQDLLTLKGRIEDTTKGCTRALFDVYTEKLVNANKERKVATDGEAYRLAVRTKQGRNFYLKDDGTYTTDSLAASIYVLGSSADGTKKILAGNNNEDLYYFRNGGLTQAAYETASCDLNCELMTNKETVADVLDATGAAKYATVCLTDGNGKVATMTSPDKATATGTCTWEEPQDVVYMNDELSSAIVMEPVVYPYTHPNFAHGTSDGRQGGFATIWLPFPMHFPDGIEVYKGTYMRDAKTGEICPYLMLTEVDKGNVTAAGGYLLYNAEQTESKMKQLVLPAPANPEDLREEEDAAFIGSTENPGQTGDATLWTEKFVNEYGDDFIPYVLADKSKDGKGIGFFRYTGATYPKGKAIYLSPKPAQGEAPAECIMFSFDDVIEAIESLHGHAITSEIYDLQGHRLNKVQKGQINVINGTKVMFK